MKILVIGDRERTVKYTPEAVFAAHEFRFVSPVASDEEKAAAFPEASVIIDDAVGVVSAEVMDAMPDLKLIHSEGVGFNGVDVKAARERGIDVCNCKAANAPTVAEQTILLMIGALRDVVAADMSVREGRQIIYKESAMVSGSIRELGELTVGLIGFGDIAREVARRLQPFGSKILYSNRRGPVDNDWGAQYRDRDALLAESDIVSLHLPSNPQTRHLANAEFFAKMKPGSIFVNTARGDITDSEALIEAIASGRVAAAGLDCFEGEPVGADNIILTLSREKTVSGTDIPVAEKILMSPHIGGITGAAFRRSYGMIWDNIERLGRGEPLERVVNGQTAG